VATVSEIPVADPAGRRSTAQDMSDDDRLVVAARQRDEAAWRELYGRHAAAVRRVCAGFGTLSEADVADAVQETFLRAFERLNQLRDTARVRPWLLSIARSRCLNRLASGGAAERGRAAFAADPARGAGAPRHDAESVVRAQRVQIVRDLIARLPDGPEAETVRLFYIEGELSAREIAQRMGVGKSAVTMRLERFRARIKARLAAELARAGLEGG